MVQHKSCSITALSASFVSDTGIFSSQEAYLKIKCDGQVFKTSSKKNTGLLAIWNEEFNIRPIRRENSITFTALAKNIIADDWIGETKP